MPQYFLSCRHTFFIFHANHKSTFLSPAPARVTLSYGDRTQLLHMRPTDISNSAIKITRTTVVSACLESVWQQGDCGQPARKNAIPFCQLRWIRLCKKTSYNEKMFTRTIECAGMITLTNCQMKRLPNCTSIKWKEVKKYHFSRWDYVTCVCVRAFIVRRKLKNGQIFEIKLHFSYFLFDSICKHCNL